MDAHDTVVLLDSDQDDGETAETGGARRSARRKRPRTGLDGGMLSSVVILDGVTAIVRPSQWTLLTLSELSRRASVKDGEGGARVLPLVVHQNGGKELGYSPWSFTRTLMGERS